MHIHYRNKTAANSLYLIPLLLFRSEQETGVCFYGGALHLASTLSLKGHTHTYKHTHTPEATERLKSLLLSHFKSDAKPSSYESISAAVEIRLPHLPYLDGMVMAT